MWSTNAAIMSEQAQAADWELWEFASEMVWWAEAFQIQFFSKFGGCPTPVIGYATTHKGNLGSYRLTRNAFGLACEINLNRQYIRRPRWGVLATLFHEMLHALENSGLILESARTRTWHHKQWFRDVMEAHGFHCGDNGAHESVDLDGDFFWFIRKHGVTIDPEDFDMEFASGGGAMKVKDQRDKPQSRQQKWTCDCTSIKLSRKIEDFDARCNHCGVDFQPELDNNL